MIRDLALAINNGRLFVSFSLDWMTISMRSTPEAPPAPPVVVPDAPPEPQA